MGIEQAGVVDRPLDDALGTLARPTWRGRLHLIALLCAIPLAVGLAIESDGARSRAGVIVYAVGLCSTLAVSTTYHRWVHTLQARARWRRLDHATIFALIAGTCSALALTSLSTGPAIAVLISIWCAAAVGAVLKLRYFERASRLGPAVYIAMGWSGAALAPAIWQRGGTLAFVCFAAGGLVYTVGALGFARRWPTLRPTTFSYHEVWHAFTIAAAGLHFTTITALST
ncbi:MAG: hemolysin III family protein [Ilumatobacter sp.]|nr:hemolysin III family protein [Ilumatobacter sp.]